ncbi:hypothetical protein [Streptomyces sp. R35]|uniref:Uncharacterized protein n=1 Tax=Streptomyces sp. R35 TaxID=3238630 RepID=A0AB39RZY6_9ACTN
MTTNIPCCHGLHATKGTSLQERLEGARSNLWFADKRVADLEIQLLEQQQAARAAVVARSAARCAD